MFSVKEKEEVAKLVQAYSTTSGKDQIIAFENLLKLFKKAYRNDMQRFCNQTSEYDMSQTIALYEDVFMTVLFKYAEGDFVRILGRSLHNKKCNIIRDLQRERKDIKENLGVMVTEGKKKSSNDKEYSFEIPSQEPTIEDTIIERLDHTQYREGRYQAIIDDLLTKTDDLTREYVKSFIENDFNYTAVAKAFSTSEKKIHHETVRRKIQKLAKGYDKERFGEVKAIINR